MVFSKQDILWLDISMEDSVPVHVIDGLDQLVHVVLYTVLW